MDFFEHFGIILDTGQHRLILPQDTHQNLYPIPGGVPERDQSDPQTFATTDHQQTNTTTNQRFIHPRTSRGIPRSI